MSNKNKFKHKVKVGDYLFDCQSCGMTCWHSTTKKLDINTGKGGLIVCKNCVYATDYGLIPYKIPAEKPVTQTGSTSTTYEQTRDPVDLSTFDPLSGNLS